MKPSSTSKKRLSAGNELVENLDGRSPHDNARDGVAVRVAHICSYGHHMSERMLSRLISVERGLSFHVLTERYFPCINKTFLTLEFCLHYMRYAGENMTDPVGAHVGYHSMHAGPLRC